MKSLEIIKEIRKGFSEDEKYLARWNNELVVLRTFTKNFERRQQEANLLIQLQQLSTNCLQLRYIDEQTMITSYIEGVDAEEAILQLSTTEQYEVGLHASQDLLKIHQIKAPHFNWALHQRQKYFKYEEKLNSLQLHFPQKEQITTFINSHLHLMSNVQSVLLHDDFHLPNLIINNRLYAGVIDFGRFDWGDPYWDFIKLGMFASEKSPHFCKGLIDGYFDHNIPADFWQRYSLYLAMNTFSMLVWGHHLETYNELFTHVQRILNDHDYFNQVIPSWYTA